MRGAGWEVRGAGVRRLPRRSGKRRNPRKAGAAIANVAAEGFMSALQLLLLVLVTVTTAGCELAGDIFQAGAWVGAIAIILVIGIVAFIAAKIRS